MAIIFPEKLVVIIKDDEDRLVEKKLAVSLTLFAQEKNDYSFAEVSKNGQTTFTKEQVRREIDLHKQRILMDYKSNLEECKEIAQIHLLSGNEVEEAIEGHKLWKDVLDISVSKIEALQNAQNYKYEPKTLMVKLNDPKYAEEKTVVIKTKRKQ